MFWRLRLSVGFRETNPLRGWLGWLVFCGQCVLRNRVVVIFFVAVAALVLVLVIVCTLCRGKPSPSPICASCFSGIIMVSLVLRDFDLLLTQLHLCCHVLSQNSLVLWWFAAFQTTMPSHSPCYLLRRFWFKQVAMTTDWQHPEWRQKTSEFAVVVGGWNFCRFQQQNLSKDPWKENQNPKWHQNVLTSLTHGLLALHLGECDQPRVSLCLFIALIWCPFPRHPAGPSEEVLKPQAKPPKIPPHKVEPRMLLKASDGPKHPET